MQRALVERARSGDIEAFTQLVEAGFPRLLVVLEANQMPATCVGAWGVGAEIVIRDNVIHGCPFQRGVEIDARNRALIEDNDIWVEEQDPPPSIRGMMEPRVGVFVFGEGSGPITIRDNDLHNSRTGIEISSEAQVEVSGNRIVDNDVGVRFTSGSVPTFVDNVLCGNGRDYAVPVDTDEVDLVALNKTCSPDEAS